MTTEQTKVWQYGGKTWNTINPELIVPYSGQPMRFTEHGVQLAIMKSGHKVEHRMPAGHNFTFNNGCSYVKSQSDLELAIDRQFMYDAQDYTAAIAQGAEPCGNFLAGVVFDSGYRDGVAFWKVGDREFPLSEYPTPDEVWQNFLAATPASIRPEFQSAEMLGEISPTLLERLAEINYREMVFSDGKIDWSSDVMYDPQERLWHFMTKNPRGMNDLNLELACTFAEMVDIYAAFKEMDTDRLFQLVYARPEQYRHLGDSHSRLMIADNGKFRLVADFTTTSVERGYHLVEERNSRFLGLISKADALAEMKRALVGPVLFAAPPNETAAWPREVAGKPFYLLVPGAIEHLRSISHDAAMEEHGIRCEMKGGKLLFSVRFSLPVTADGAERHRYYEINPGKTDAATFADSVRFAEVHGEASVREDLDDSTDGRA